MDIRVDVSLDGAPGIGRDQRPVAAAVPSRVAGTAGWQSRALLSRLGANLPWAAACLAVDAVMLGAGAAVAELGAPRAGVPPLSGLWLLAFPVLVVGLFRARGLYAPRLSLRILDGVRPIVASTTIAAMTVVGMSALTAGETLVAGQALRLWAFGTLFLLGGRTVLTWAELEGRRRGETLKPTLIVGAGHVGRLVAKRLLAHPELGLRPVGFLDRDPLPASNGTMSLPVLGASWDLEEIVRSHRIEQVIVTFSTAPHEVLLRLVRRCEELGLRTALVPRLFDRMTERIQVEHVGGLPLIAAEVANPHGRGFALKHVVDRMVAAVALTLVAPVFALAAVGVWISLGRPIFFRQARVGRDGNVFEMLKFRTMRTAERPTMCVELAPDTAPGGVEGEDRRTSFGDLLRRTSLDELPQLINVLRGEMSLVGPRPERPEYVGLFGEQVPRYHDRHRVKAGITGWAQVHGLRGKTSISERAELDNYYVQNWSLGLDVRILLMTVAAVFRSYRTVE